MSALPAPQRGRRLPKAATETSADQRRRHIEIVSSRSQRRARPRLLAAIVTVGGLFAILAAQLLLTIATSEGAYEIASLQSAQAELARDEEVLAEGIRVLEAPQHLAGEAQAMGMVPSNGAAQLRLSDAAVLGSPQAAAASSALMTAPDGTALIPNSLLTDIELVGATSKADAAETAAALAGTAGAPAGTSPDGSLPSDAPVAPVGIPTPVTH